MTYQIEIDASACNGYGNCVLAAPEVFDLDPVTNVALVLPGHPVEADAAALVEAEIDCPARAIRLSRQWQR